MAESCSPMSAKALPRVVWARIRCGFNSRALRHAAMASGIWPCSAYVAPMRSTAATLTPHLMSAHTNLGNAFADMGEHDSAIAEHRVVIALDSTKSTGYVDLGSALESMGRDEDAITQYKRAIELDPREDRKSTRLNSSHT